MVKIDVETCVGCGGCIDLCPATAISLVNDRSRIDVDLCLECLTCVKVCPVKAPQVVQPTVGTGQSSDFPGFTGWTDV